VKSDTRSPIGQNGMAGNKGYVAVKEKRCHGPNELSFLECLTTLFNGAITA